MSEHWCSLNRALDDFYVLREHFAGICRDEHLGQFGDCGSPRTPGRGGGHHQRELEHKCGLCRGHYVVLQLSEGNVTHSAVQADLVIDEYHGGTFTRDVTSA